MSLMPRSKWRRHSGRVIAEALAVLATTNPGASEKEKRRAVRAAYPYGERQGHPYQCWLREVNIVFPKPRPDEPRHKVLRGPGGVFCDWCLDGCIFCQRMRTEHAEWLAGHRDVATAYDQLFAASVEDEGLRPILADFCEEHGFEEMAAYWRGSSQ